MAAALAADTSYQFKSTCFASATVQMLTLYGRGTGCGYLAALPADTSPLHQFKGTCFASATVQMLTLPLPR
jgi:hypothetical protein